MLPVSVFVNVRGREVALEKVSDPSVIRVFKGVAADIGKKLAATRCPVHDKTASSVRVHIDQRGAADLRYESCCEKLRDAIGRALG
jgi:hypothetical protein